MKPKKITKKAVWKGWGVKNIHTGNFSPVSSYLAVAIAPLREILLEEVTPDEKVVKVEVREV